MGEIKKQGVSNSILILIGAMVGALNVLVLYPLILPKEYFGLTTVLVQVSYIAAQFGLIGAHIAIVKYWNTFKNNFILFKYLLRNTIIFSIIVIIALVLFKPEIISEYQEKAALFTQNYDYLYLLFFFGVVFELSFSISQANLKTSFPIFLKEIFLRVYQTILLASLYFQWINLTLFISFFIAGYAIIAILISIYVYQQKVILKPIKEEQLSSEGKKGLFKYSIINFLTGFSAGIVSRLDILMIGALLVSSLDANFSLKAVAIYTVAIYVTNMIEMPSKGLFSITSPIIARLWHKNDIEKISDLYKKTSINLSIISILLFVLLWTSIDELLFFVPQYQAAKDVIFILGLSKVFNMVLGINNGIIVTSKYYRIIPYTMVFLIAITFLLNYLLIPKYQLVGAAIGSLISLVLYNLVTFLFLWYKYKLQPFSWDTIKVFALGGGIFYLFTFINIDAQISSILVKSIGISLIYVLIIYKLKLSVDINELIDKTLFSLKMKKKH